MSSKKWVLVFLVTVLVLAALLAALNLAADPFGAFGDRLLSWFSYDETNNPRVAKFSYLEQHHDEYDSYILGCSSTSSFPVDAFNEAYGASFYNLIMYGADMRDCEKIARYLIEHYEVKNLILNVYLDNGLTYDEESDRLTKNLHYKEDPDTSVLSYYTRYLFADPRYALAKLNALRTDTILPQTFDVFDERTGCYDKRVRDAEPIGSEERYLESYPVFADYPHQTLSLPYTEQCMQSVAAIKTLCEEAGVNLTVAAGPVYAEYLKNYEPETVAQFYRSLAQVTPFWDFSSSSVSCEMRYFYDGTHFRNNVGEMICARMTGRTDLWIPDDFGTYVTADTPEDYFLNVLSPAALSADEISTQVPILMYHHLSEDVTNSEIVSPEQFEAQIRALSEAGYTGVSFDELQAYVLRGEPLPEKPVVITFDDGYRSNYELLFPLLQAYQMKAVVSIMVYMQDVSADNFLSWDMCREMADSGLVEIGSHAYSLHNLGDLGGNFDPGGINGIQRDPEESDSAFEARVLGDIQKSHDRIAQEVGQPVTFFAYPFGITEPDAEAFVHELFPVTAVTSHGTADLGKGLHELPRMTVTMDRELEDILKD